MGGCVAAGGWVGAAVGWAPACVGAGTAEGSGVGVTAQAANIRLAKIHNVRMRKSTGGLFIISLLCQSSERARARVSGDWTQRRRGGSSRLPGDW